MGDVMRRTRLMATVIALTTMMTAVACSPAPTTTAPVVTSPPSGISTVWAFGDSQGAKSNDPNRGIPWTERIGNVRNGADNMYGAGWTVGGTFTGRTIAQHAAHIESSGNRITRIVVMAGINDLSAGKSVSHMLGGVDALANWASARGIAVAWVGVVPVPQHATISNRNADRLAFNRGMAQRFGPWYLDCAPYMANAAGWLQPAYSLSPTDLHLSSAGEQALANCVAGRF